MNRSPATLDPGQRTTKRAAKPTQPTASRTFPTPPELEVLPAPRAISKRLWLVGLFAGLSLVYLAFSYLLASWHPAHPTVLANANRGQILLRDGTVMADRLPTRSNGSAATKRAYPQGNLAGQVIGFQGRDRGLEGIEYFRDQALKSGQDVTLTLDPVFQAAAEAALERTVKAQGAQAGAVVALEAATGRVLAMANYPKFDPANWSRYPSQARLNRALRAQFEPGSTVKALVAAALIDAGQATPEDRIIAPMTRTLGRHVINDVVPHPNELSLTDVLRYSSNVGISNLAERLSPKQLHGYLTAFGLGQPMPLDGASTTPGVLRDWRGEQPLDRAAVSFGQGMSTTVLQLASAFSVLTNDGRLVPPKLIETPPTVTGAKADGKADGKTAERRVISQKAARQTRTMLRAVAEGRLAKVLGIPGYCLGGKTGTAQVAVNGRYSKDLFAALFAGHFPCEKPRVTMVVEIYGPKKQINGSQVAAPVFREIAEEVLAYWQVQPNLERSSTGPEVAPR